MNNSATLMDIVNNSAMAELYKQVNIYGYSKWMIRYYDTSQLQALLWIVDKELHTMFSIL